MRKNDPIKRHYAIIAVSFALGVLSLVYEAFGFSHNSIASPFANFIEIFVTVYILLMIYVVFATIRLHKRMEERRRRASTGDPSLLAEPQPQPDANALSLPATISMKLNMRFQFLVVGVMLVLVFIVMGVVSYFVSSGHSFNNAVFWIVMGIVFVFIALIWIGMAFFSKFLYNRVFDQKIVVDEYGVATHYFGKCTSLRWEEIESFDIWGAKTARVTPFELVGKESVVRWMMPRRYRLFYPFRPAESYEEYCQKMDALQRVIVAKTGRPMYDLRDKKIVWW